MVEVEQGGLPAVLRHPGAEQRVDAVDPGRVVLDVAGRFGQRQLGLAEVRARQDHHLRAPRAQHPDRVRDGLEEVLVVLGCPEAQPLAVDAPVDDVPRADEQQRDLGLELVEEPRPAVRPVVAPAGRVDERPAFQHLPAAGDAAAEHTPVPEQEACFLLGALEPEAHRGCDRVTDEQHLGGRRSGAVGELRRQARGRALAERLDGLLRDARPHADRRDEQRDDHERRRNRRDRPRPPAGERAVPDRLLDEVVRGGGDGERSPRGG